MKDFMLFILKGMFAAFILIAITAIIVGVGILLFGDVEIFLSKDLYISLIGGYVAAFIISLPVVEVE